MIKCAHMVVITSMIVRLTPKAASYTSSMIKLVVYPIKLAATVGDIVVTIKPLHTVLC